MARCQCVGEVEADVAGAPGSPELMMYEFGSGFCTVV